MCETEQGIRSATSNKQLAKVCVSNTQKHPAIQFFKPCTKTDPEAFIDRHVQAIVRCIADKRKTRAWIQEQHCQVNQRFSLRDQGAHWGNTPVNRYKSFTQIRGKSVAEIAVRPLRATLRRFAYWRISGQRWKGSLPTAGGWGSYHVQVRKYLSLAPAEEIQNTQCWQLEDGGVRPSQIEHLHSTNS